SSRIEVEQIGFRSEQFTRTSEKQFTTDSGDQSDVRYQVLSGANRLACRTRLGPIFWSVTASRKALSSHSRFPRVDCGRSEVVSVKIARGGGKTASLTWFSGAVCCLAVKDDGSGYEAEIAMIRESGSNGFAGADDSDDHETQASP